MSQKEKIVYPWVEGKEEYDIPDFTHAPSNLLVVHSPHWHREMRYKPEVVNDNLPIVGVVVDKDFFQDSKGRVICHPTVAWEGQAGGGGSMTHPMNVVPYRASQQLPTVKMDNGQWGTYGPNGPPPIDYYI